MYDVSLVFSSCPTVHNNNIIPLTCILHQDLKTKLSIQTQKDNANGINEKVAELVFYGIKYVTFSIEKADKAWHQAQAECRQL